MNHHCGSIRVCPRNDSSIPVHAELLALQATVQILNSTVSTHLEKICYDKAGNACIHKLFIFNN